MYVFDLICVLFDSLGSSDPNNKACFLCRITTYLQSTRPIIEQYEKHGKVRTIDASRPVGEVGTYITLLFFSCGNTNIFSLLRFKNTHIYIVYGFMMN